MSRRQRLSFLGIAAVIAVIAVVIVIVASGGGDDGGSSASAASAPGPLLTAGAEQKLEVTEGDTVHFRVKVDQADEVHVHGYDIEKEAAAGQTVSFSFPASITGIFEIELHHADTQIGQLTVNPK